MVTRKIKMHYTKIGKCPICNYEARYYPAQNNLSKHISCVNQHQFTEQDSNFSDLLSEFADVPEEIIRGQ